MSVTNQNHSGLGDNVNQKIVQSLSPENFKENIYRFFLYCFTEDFSQAESVLSTLNFLGDKSEDSAKIIKLLNSYFNYIQGRNWEDFSYVSSQDNLLLDIYSSFLFVTSKSEKEKLNIWNKYKDNNYLIWLKVFYIQLLADTYELDRLYNLLESQKPRLDDLDHLNLAQGYFRVFNYRKSIEHIEKIKNTSRYLKGLKINVLLNIIDSENPKFNVLSCNKKTFELLNTISQGLVTLDETYGNLNKSECDILVNLVKITNFSLKESFDLFFKYELKILTIFPELKDNFDKIDSKKCRQMEVVLKSEIVLQENNVTLLITLILNDSINVKHLKRWKAKNGKVTETLNEIYRQYLNILIDTYISISGQYKCLDTKNLENIRSFFKNPDISKISMFLCSGLIEKIFKLREPPAKDINKFLEPHIQKDHALTPLYFHYLESLLYIDQYQTFENHFKQLDINDVFFTPKLLDLNIQFLLDLEEYMSVLEFVDNSLAINECSSYLWYYKIRLELLLNTKSLNDLLDILNLIPKHIFNIITKNEIGLLKLIAYELNFNYAMNILVPKFFEDPDKYAELITEIQFNTLSKSKKRIEYISDVVEILSAYSIKIKNKKCIVLIHDFENEYNSKYFLSEDSELAELIQTTKIRKTFHHKHKEYKVLEKVSVEVAIFLIAKKIYSNQNQTDSKFFMKEYKTPKNPDKLLLMVKKMLKENDEANKSKEDIFTDQNIPLYFKEKFVFPTKGKIPFVNAIVDQPFFIDSLESLNQGIILKDKIILDTYSLIFLCLSNLSKALINQNIEIFITSSTKKIILSEIENLDQESLTLWCVNNNLIKSDNKEIKLSYAQLIRNVNDIFKVANELSPSRNNSNPVLAELKFFLCPSIYKAISKAYTHNIPYLCLDKFFLIFLGKINDSILINPLRLFKSLYSKLNFEDQKITLNFFFSRKIFLDLQVSLFTLLELSKAKEETSFRILHNMFNYGNYYPNSQLTIDNIGCFYYQITRNLYENSNFLLEKTLFDQLISNIIQSWITCSHSVDKSRSGDFIKTLLFNIYQNFQNYGTVTQSIFEERKEYLKFLIKKY